MKLLSVNKWSDDYKVRAAFFSQSTSSTICNFTLFDPNVWFVKNLVRQNSILRQHWRHQKTDSFGRPCRFPNKSSSLCNNKLFATKSFLTSGQTASVSKNGFNLTRTQRWLTFFFVNSDNFVAGIHYYQLKCS
jgi:hypothetical protein